MKLTPAERAKVDAIRKETGVRFRALVFQKKRIRCGKPKCGKCGKGGRGHGPYFYAFWRDGKKVRSIYVGKKPKPVPVSR